MKKCILFVLMSMIIIALSACGNTSAQNDDDQNVYGGEQTVWNTLYNPNTSFGGISSLFSDLISEEQWKAKVDYLESHKSSENLMSSENYYTILSFINEFAITKKAFEEANWSAGEEFAPFSQEEIDLLYSGDMNKILEHFITPYAVLHKNQAYTLEWFEKNPASMWLEKEISPADVRTALDKASQAEAKPDSQNIDALTTKISDYEKLVDGK